MKVTSIKIFKEFGKYTIPPKMPYAGFNHYWFCPEIGLEIKYDEGIYFRGIPDMEYKYALITVNIRLLIFYIRIYLERRLK